MRLLMLACWVGAAAACADAGPVAEPKTSKSLPLNKTLVDVTAKAGLPGQSKLCLIFQDFTNDGKPDLMLAPLDVKGLALYVNRGDGTFERHPVALPDQTELHTCAAADYDADGWLDVALTVASKQGVMLLHNRGAPGDAFDVASSVAVDLTVPHHAPLGFFDYDRDGWPDLYVGQVAFPDPMQVHCTGFGKTVHCERLVPFGNPSYLLHNMGGKTFELVDLVVPNKVLCNAVQFIDWDGDGWMDVFEANDIGRNYLYRNLQGKGFADLLTPLHADGDNNAMGAAFGDLDRDGLWDLYISEEGPDKMYYGTAGGGIVDRAETAGQPGVTSPHSGWAPRFVDLDNDGYLDIFVANTLVLPTDADMIHFLTDLVPVFPDDTPYNQADFVLMSHRGKTFEASRVPYAKLLPADGIAMTATADYDADGLVDVAVLTATYGRTLAFRMFHNTTSNTHHWLDLRLLGNAPNRGALGAVVTLQDSRGVDRRPVGTGGIGVSSDVIHFGLGPEGVVKRLTIAWPTGQKQEVPLPIKVDRLLTVQQAPLAPPP